MAYIPPDAEWFIADLVFAISVQDDPRSVTHINRVLVHATTPEDAYTAALDLGRQDECDDVNPAGKVVTTRFLGIRQLTVVHDRLEHGAELSYTERIGLTTDEQNALLTKKDALGVFAPLAVGDRPDYSCADILNEAHAIVQGKASRNNE